MAGVIRSAIFEKRDYIKATLEMTMFNKKNKLQHSVTLATMMMLSGLSVSAWADQYEDAAKKWAASEFKPSTLSDAEQLKELEWFIKAAGSISFFVFG
ncbi:ABC transporter, periplasmic substrate-binding protein, partial [Pseudomonas savastanoi pv. glycinea]